MFETVHILTGLVVGTYVQNPAVAFAAGIASHLALDAIPHWDGQGLVVKRTGQQFSKRGFTKTGRIIVGLDMAASILVFAFLALYERFWPGFPNPYSFFANLFSHPSWILGALGGIVPDFLSLVNIKTGFAKPLLFFKFHTNIQKEMAMLPGLAFQIALVIGLVFIFLR